MSNPTTCDKNDGCWRDITQEFRESVKHLKLGELLKTEQFTLLEAMSAIELMDPRMDSGMVLEKANRQILTLEQSVRAGLVKVNQLEPEELIGIIDDTYSTMTNWLEGHSIAQTVMTNIYLHDTERIEDRCLRVFSQSILKLVDFIDKMVYMACCIEEEDFMHSNMARFNIFSQYNEQKVFNSLEDMCQYYEKLLIDDNKSNQTESRLDHDQSQKITAIVDRLRFTQNFYACFLNISKNLLKEYNIVSQNLPNPAASNQKTIKLVQSSAINCDQHLDKCLEYIDKWNNTIELGIKPKCRNEGRPNESDYPTIMGFEPLINHKILPPAYPRCSMIRTRPYTVNYLRNLVIKLRECIRISSNFYQKSFGESVDSIERFSKYFRPASCVISRSFLQMLYLPNRIVSMMKEVLLQSINDYCEPLIQAIKKDEAKFTALNEFLEESSTTFSLAVVLFGHNSARQHERFPGLILSFKNLQYAAFLMNDIFKNSIVYSWTTYHLATFCIKYFLSSLELELFSPHEYPYVFWYLYDILYRNEKEELELAKQQLIFENQLTIEDFNPKKTKGGKKPKRKNQFDTSRHDKKLLRNDAFRFFTGGMFLLTHGLKIQGKIKTPSMEFTSEEICFDHRFCSITDTSVYQAYKLTLSRFEKLETIYREAFDCFAEAKILFERDGELEDCLKVCKANMVVAKILSTNLDSFANRDVELCFDKHPSFPAVKF